MSADTRKKIRLEVCKRADGACEHCGVWVGDAGELDHQAGRGKGREPESVANCWLLCRQCHRKRTDYVPDAAYWLTAFINHCGKYGYSTERAEARLDFVKARAAS